MSGESAFVVLLGLCLLLILTFFMIEEDQKQAERDHNRLLDVCRVVEGEVVEDMCLKDNRIIYRKER